MAFGARGLAAVLDLAQGDAGNGRPTLSPLLAALTHAAEAHDVSLFELDLVANRERFYQSTDVAEEGEPGPGPDDLFWTFFWSGACSYTEPGTPFARAGSRTAVVSPPQLYGSWRDYQATPESEYHLSRGLGKYVIVPLTTGEGASRRILINRPAEDRPFDEWDLVALRLLQPHLDAAATRALTSSKAALLSARELQVVAYARAGHANKSIARLLQLEPCTVRKHLENAYRKLGVQSRTAAVAAVFGWGQPYAVAVPDQ